MYRGSDRNKVSNWRISAIPEGCRRHGGFGRYSRACAWQGKWALPSDPSVPSAAASGIRHICGIHASGRGPTASGQSRGFPWQTPIACQGRGARQESATHGRALPFAQGNDMGDGASWPEGAISALAGPPRRPSAPLPPWRTHCLPYAGIAIEATTGRHRHSRVRRRCNDANPLGASASWTATWRTHLQDLCGIVDDDGGRFRAYVNSWVGSSERLAYLCKNCIF